MEENSYETLLFLYCMPYSRCFFEPARERNLRIYVRWTHKKKKGGRLRTSDFIGILSVQSNVERGLFFCHFFSDILQLIFALFCERSQQSSIIFDVNTCIEIVLIVVYKIGLMHSVYEEIIC